MRAIWNRIFLAAIGAAIIACGGEPPRDDTGPLAEENVRDLDIAELSSSCAGLVPALLAAPREAVATGDGTCLSASADGIGDVALETLEEHGAATEWRLYSPGGAALGEVRVDGYAELLPQPLGFHAVRVGEAAPPALSAYSEQGELWQETALWDPDEEAPVWTAAAPVPAGGAVAIVSASTDDAEWTVTAQRFDAQGRRMNGPRTVVEGEGESMPFVYAGVDVQGRTLVLWDDDVNGEGPHVLWGRWLDPAGRRLTRSFVISVDEHPAGPPRVVPLVGGGLALAHGVTWERVLPAGGARPLAAPAWLTSNPDTTPQLIHAGQGYALLPGPSIGPVCEQVIAIHAANGRRCGAVRIPVSPCQPASVSLGRDGTLVQLLQGDHCAVRWWPRLFP